MNCKPGDLAYIVHALLPENVGSIVEVLCADVYRFAEESVECPRWVCKHTSPCLAVDRRTEKVSIALAGEFLSIPDSSLRPISGVPVLDEVKDEVAA